MHYLASIFKLNTDHLSASRALVVGYILLIEVTVLITNNDAQYILSTVVGTLFVGLSDPGGRLLYRLWHMAPTLIIGALLTVLAFVLGPGDWWWAALATLLVTLAGGLSLRFGLHGFVVGVLLDVWFVIALGCSYSYGQNGIAINPWDQALAWLVGGGAWLALVVLLWAIRRGATRQQPVTEIPEDTTSKQLTRPAMMFAIIRAVAMGMAVAIPFGFNLDHGYWLPIATIVALKPSLVQSAQYAVQRLLGAVIGALAAVILLAVISTKLLLLALAQIALTGGVAIRFVNYVWYNALIATGVLIALDIAQPTNLQAEGLRVLYTFIGAGIGVLVMYLASLLGKRPSKHN